MATLRANGLPGGTRNWVRAGLGLGGIPGQLRAPANMGLGVGGSPCLKTLGCLHSWMWAWVSRLMGIRPLCALLSKVICRGVAGQGEPE